MSATPSTVAWLTPQYASPISAYRACELCTHQVRSGAAQYCRHPDVAGPFDFKPVAAARALHGGCGPDADHLSMTWLPS